MSQSSADSSRKHDFERELIAVMFSDVVSFSTKMSHNEEKTLHDVNSDLEKLKKLAERHRGKVIKSLGDGLMIVFRSATEALQCALLFQDSSENDEFSHPNLLQHRIGIHVGEMLVKQDEIMGSGVNLAARLQAIASPGGICISKAVYESIKNKASYSIQSMGARRLKNIPEAVEVYQILNRSADEESFKPRFSQYLLRLKPLIIEKCKPLKEKYLIPIFTHKFIQKRRKEIIAGGVLLLAVFLCLGFWNQDRSFVQLTPNEVEKAIQGHKLNLGQILFAPREGRIQRKRIRGLTLKKINYSTSKEFKHCIEAEYLMIYQTPLGKSRHYAIQLLYDKSKAIENVSIRGPLN